MTTQTEALDLSLDEILVAVPGQLMNPGSNSQIFSEMAYDSRKASPGSIFLCIQGERSDAHDFIPDVIQRGSTLIIGDQSEKLAQQAKLFPKTQFLAVQSSLEALQSLATFYRRKFSIPVIGLSGSSGKTTTKDLTGAILNIAGPALVTEGTLNNHWGVPQMVMRLRRAHRSAMFEMGISNFRELTELSSICQPRIGYLTTIGAAHLEFFKNAEGVLKAKRELFDWILKYSDSSILVFNLDNPLLEKLYHEIKASNSSQARLISISHRHPKADVKLTQNKALGMEHRYGWEYAMSTPWGEIRGRLPLPGAHNLTNAMAAATLALATETVSIDDVIRGLEQPAISKMRSELFRMPSGPVVYNDSYNANPTSVAALFEAARLIRTGGEAQVSKTIAVVGDMLELGPNSEDLHRQMGSRAAQDGISVLLSTGQFAKSWVEGFLQDQPNGIAHAFNTQDELLATLLKELKTQPQETLVLVKGSRGARMDQIVERIRNV